MSIRDEGSVLYDAYHHNIGVIEYVKYTYGNTT
jgi:hypothetical protein